MALAASLILGTAGARADDAAKYPELNGQWSRAGNGAQWDPTKPGGLRQQAPLTAEYQAIFEANLKSLASGNEAYNGHSRCIPAGMPRMMLAYEPVDVIVTPETTYVRDYFNEFRRIYTDGRAWPAEIAPSFNGYSIGRWEDQDADGRYHVLVVETRGFKGPRVFDATGIPLHADDNTVIKERISLDQADRDVLHDEVTTIDDALTRPWTVTRSYNRARSGMAGVHLRRGQSPRHGRPGNLFSRRRRPIDAHPQGPAAAGIAGLRSAAKVSFDPVSFIRTSRVVRSHARPCATGVRHGLCFMLPSPS
jgi:hypothetical protein